MTPPTALIYAGTFQQYLSYCRSHRLDPRTVRYVERPESLLGRHEAILIRFGTWYKREDRPEIEELCRTGRFEIRDEA